MLFNYHTEDLKRDLSLFPVLEEGRQVLVFFFLLIHVRSLRFWTILTYFH